MSRRNMKTGEAMLDLWRPPQGAGEPLGCLATTFTFQPALFDEQCLARFLEIDSEPNREDLAFLLEREYRLGNVYAGVLVDDTQAGVEHSLRWDVLPVRIRGGKQHSKISLLAWSHHVRIIFTSANLTEPGYRSNREVAGVVDLKPDDADRDLLDQTLDFLRKLLSFVPAASERPPEIIRAESFLADVEKRSSAWKQKRKGGAIRQQLAFTLPAAKGHSARSSLNEAIQACRKRGGSPTEVWIASPFFDPEEETSRITVELCKSMARGRTRTLHFCVPEQGTGDDGDVPRLAAPKALLTTPDAYQGVATVWTLPLRDNDNNIRSWHAKMLGLFAEEYAAVMVGSSNFTCAGMGVTGWRNAEANLVLIADRAKYGREVGQIRDIWPEMNQVLAPDEAEWLGARTEQEEEEDAATLSLPEGFLSATYRAGDARQLTFRLDPDRLPETWVILATGQNEPLLSSGFWSEQGRPAVATVPWAPVQPPERLLVRWEEQEAFLPFNVEDRRALPPPSRLEEMSADDMLLILAAADPSAAFRAWARRQKDSELFDDELDSATPPDLNPLGRYDLYATFLHRVRGKARILARVRENLQRPVWGKQALEWRLWGLIGIAELANRLVGELDGKAGTADEALLTLADFLIVLREVDYQQDDGALSKREFDAVFRPFLGELADHLGQRIGEHAERISDDVSNFWERVLVQCQN